ncbi:hypothetical protein G6F51_014558 [Rhizopus arrhizus]|uniref:Uncharacterized protein n=1 Tax=Rhizopus oryzae TaxID=64495 RepID=A0A9P6XLX7_RHIOR|nr:hypothetical protein G6F51_014558 [Rhizopus arrhizus]
MPSAYSLHTSVTVRSLRLRRYTGMEGAEERAVVSFGWDAGRVGVSTAVGGGSGELEGEAGGVSTVGPWGGGTWLRVGGGASSESGGTTVGFDMVVLV